MGGQNIHRFSDVPYHFFLLFFLISLIADGPHHYHPACGHKGSSHLSPVHALQFVYRDASSALLQLVNQWLNFYTEHIYIPGSCAASHAVPRSCLNRCFFSSLQASLAVENSLFDRACMMRQTPQPKSVCGRVRKLHPVLDAIQLRRACSLLSTIC